MQPRAIYPPLVQPHDAASPDTRSLRQLRAVARPNTRSLVW